MIFPHVVLLVRGAPLVAGYAGSKTRGWSQAMRTPSPANMQAESSREELDARDTTVSRYRAYLPAGTVLATEDRVEWNGLTLEVVGEPEDWARGGRGHVKALLERVEV